MKRAELIELLQGEELVEGDQEVVIRTDKQLLPNATYKFEISIDNDYTIVLSPTERK